MKRLYLIEIDVPSNMPLKHVRRDLQDYAQELTDGYDAAWNSERKRPARPKVRRAKMAQMVTMDRYYYETLGKPL